MRVVLDLQACQTEGSRTRGIGRYSASLTRALVEERAHDYVIACNGVYPESLRDIAAQYEPHIGADRIVSYAAPLPAEAFEPRVIDTTRVTGEWLARYAWLAAKPDLIHVNSVFEGFHGKAVVPSLAGMPSSIVLSATAYDLIPLVLADTYLGDPPTRAWYMGCIERLRRCDVLLAISEATRRDVIERLGLAPERVTNVLGAVDERFSPGAPGHERPGLLASLGVEKPYVMYTGGIDHRKNVEGLIRAYGALPRAQRDAFQLAIVCSVRESDRMRLAALARDAGLRPGTLVLTGYVDDDALVELYRACELFVFPSLYEGFGLPVLEAMSCGAPVIAARASSLPEIVGRDDALFSVGSDAPMTAALAHALRDAAFRAQLREHALAQARRFSWRETARRSEEAWRDAFERKRDRVRVAVSRARPRLALVSPLPPERSGIADFVAELLPCLAKRFEIDLFVTEKADGERYAALGYGVHPWQSLPARWTDYDGGVLYQFGNSEFHAHMIALLRACPGAVLLHDAYLSGLFAYCEFGPPARAGLFGQMLAYCHGDEAVASYRVQGREAAIDRYPMARWVVDQATGVVVTSHHARDILAGARQLDGGRCAVVPHHRIAHSVTAAERAAAKAALGVPADALLFCSFGHVHERKCSQELLDAWLHRKPAAGARLAYVGEAGGPYGEALRRRVAQLSPDAGVSITGYATDDAFLQYMRASDVVVQLRTGSRGEASGAALYAMAHGDPLVVTRHGSLAELPADACVQLDLPLDDAVLADTLARLASDAAERESLGARAQAWVREHCDPAYLADALAEHLARFNDPEIVHRRASLLTRVRALADATLDTDAGALAADTEARALQSEGARVHGDAALAIAETIAPLLPRVVSSGPYAELREEGTARLRSVALTAGDRRLRTVCGVKSDGAIRNRGMAGVLMHGPYMPMEAGAYRVRVYGETTGAPGTVRGVLEATGEAGRRRLGAVELVAGADEVRRNGVLARLDFDVPRAITDFELRMLVTPGTEMTIESIDVVALDLPETPTRH